MEFSTFSTYFLSLVFAVRLARFGVLELIDLRGQNSGLNSQKYSLDLNSKIPYY